MKAASNIDLFSPVIDRARWHPQFGALLGSAGHRAARTLMNALAQRMRDPNGQFVRHFQGHGFHSRLFELACFAYLEEAGLSVDRSHESPDFLAFDKEFGLAVEAVTSNPPAGQGTDISLKNLERLSDAEIHDKSSREFPGRVVRSLEKKLSHRYHELAHCRGKPLVLMIAPFFEAGANFYVDEALPYALFGPPNGLPRPTIPFFEREDAAPISAVLYCNQFTVSRFLRLAADFTTQCGLRGTRRGVFYCNYGEDTVALQEFVHELGAPDTPEETWSEGVTVFENPFADVPLPRGLLPATCCFSVTDGYVTREVSAFHPVVSFTHTTGGPDGEHAQPETEKGGGAIALSRLCTLRPSRVLPEAVQVVNGPLRVRGGREDCRFVGVQNLEADGICDVAVHASKNQHLRFVRLDAIQDEVAEGPLYQAACSETSGDPLLVFGRGLSCVVVVLS